jgi:PmbA protein
MKSTKSKERHSKEASAAPEIRLAEVSARAVAQAEKMGASQAEAFSLRSVISTCSIEKLEVTIAERKIQTGIGIRVASGKRIGFSCTSSMSDKSVDGTAEKAIKIARSKEEDSAFKSFPTHNGLKRVAGILDRKIVESQIEDLIEEGRSLAETAKNHDKRIQTGSGVLTSILYDRAIANSLGVELEESDTVFNSYMSTMAKDEGEVSSGQYMMSARNINEVEIDQVGTMASKLAVEQLKRKPIATKSMDLVMHPYALGDLLGNTFHPAFLGDNLMRNRSPLAGKLGQSAISELVSVDDNGTIDKGLCSQSFDDEGTPRRKTTLVSKGVIKAFLYDSHWASRARTESTGNSQRKGPGGTKTYGSEPTIDTTNIVIKPGDSNFEKLLSEVDDGIFTYYLIGAHTANEASGAFSVAVQTAFKIERGEIAYPIKQAMLGGTLLQFLSKVSAVGSDVMSTPFNLRNRVTTTPSIRFSDVKISA